MITGGRVDYINGDQVTIQLGNSTEDGAKSQ